MGLIGRVIEFGKRIARFDVGGGEELTARQFLAAGEDSQPLPTDRVALLRIPGAKRMIAVGYWDMNLGDGLALAGERRLYARDANGEPVCQLWLRNDGSVLIDNEMVAFELKPDGSASLANDPGSLALAPDGTFTINGAEIAPDGTISSPVAVVAPSVEAAGKELAGHLHPAGTPPGNTGPNS